MEKPCIAPRTGGLGRGGTAVGVRGLGEGQVRECRRTLSFPQRSFKRSTRAEPAHKREGTKSGGKGALLEVGWARWRRQEEASGIAQEELEMCDCDFEMARW